MGRAIVAVILGYIVFAAVDFVLFTGAYMALGAGRAFNSGGYDVSMLWLVLAIVINLVGAIVGGFACSLIARSGKPALAFAAIVLALGLVLAVAMPPKPTGTRTGDVPNFEAMQKAVMPTWFQFAAPFVGAVGVMIGSKRKRKS